MKFKFKTDKKRRLIAELTGQSVACQVQEEYLAKSDEANPEPYEEISIVNLMMVPGGIDTVGYNRGIIECSRPVTIGR